MSTSFRAIQLSNNFGLTDQAVIKEAEALFTTMAAIEGMPDGNFDAEHFQAIHKHALGDMYPWAGEFRTAKIVVGDNIRESNTPPALITAELGRVFKALQSEDTADMNVLEFADRMAVYYTKLYAISPFPDGNARASRFLLDKFAERNGMQIKWDTVPAQAFQAAVAQALNGNTSNLRDVFRHSTDHQDLYGQHAVSSIQGKMAEIVSSSGLRSDLVPSQQIADQGDLQKLARYTRQVLANDLAMYASGASNTMRDWERTSINHEIKNSGEDHGSGVKMLNETLERMSKASRPKGPGL